MAKTNLSLDERIAAINAAIKKEDAIIKSKREKITKLRKDLQKLETEKAQLFTNELMQIVNDCGINSDEQKQQLLKLVKNAAADLPNPANKREDG